jgi:hypothetical protein
VQAGVAERVEHAHAADAEHELLAQSVRRVSAVELAAQRAILRAVLGRVGVEEQHRHHAALGAGDVARPRPDHDRAALDRHADRRLERTQHRVGLPARRFLALAVLRIDRLHEVAAALQQRHRDGGNPEVGERADGVAGEHAEPARVRRDPRVERDLHREVRDAAVLWTYGRIHHEARLQTGYGRTKMQALRIGTWPFAQLPSPSTNPGGGDHCLVLSRLIAT